MYYADQLNYNVVSTLRAQAEVKDDPIVLAKVAVLRRTNRLHFIRIILFLTYKCYI